MNKEDKDKVTKKWSSIIDNLDVSSNKKNWLEEYTNGHMLNENLDNGLFDDSIKSEEEKHISLLPISMRISSQTIGLDLVSVNPLSSPMSGCSPEELEKMKRLEKKVNRNKKLNTILDKDTDISKEEKELKGLQDKSNSGLMYLDFVYGDNEDDD